MSTSREESWSRRFQVIGWPTPNDPFFRQRPVSGQSAGWDADFPATNVYSVYGLNLPSISASHTVNNSGVIVGGGFEIYNIAFLQSGSSNNSPVRWDNNHIYMDNITFLRDSGPYTEYRMFTTPARNTGKLIFIQSGTGAPNPTGLSIQARHFVVHYACVLRGNKYPIYIDGTGYYSVFENQCNSVEYLIGPSGETEDKLPFGILIERFIGVAPNSLANFNSVQRQSYDITIQDYLGAGPLQFRYLNGNNYVIASTLDAYHNNNFAFSVNVQSVAAGGQEYGTRMGAAVAFRKSWPVNSGQTYEIEVPVYIGSSEVWSVEPSQMPRVSWQALGDAGLHEPYSIVPGSAGLWSGSLVAGGSAWIAKYALTSQEDALNNLLFVHPRAPLQVNSGDRLIGYMMISEPYSV
jgi:hypothetical protein